MMRMTSPILSVTWKLAVWTASYHYFKYWFATNKSILFINIVLSCCKKWSFSSNRFVSPKSRVKTHNYMTRTYVRMLGLFYEQKKVLKHASTGSKWLAKMLVDHPSIDRTILLNWFVVEFLNFVCWDQCLVKLFNRWLVRLALLKLSSHLVEDEWAYTPGT